MVGGTTVLLFGVCIVWHNYLGTMEILPPLLIGRRRTPKTGEPGPFIFLHRVLLYSSKQRTPQATQLVERASYLFIMRNHDTSTMNVAMQGEV